MKATAITLAISHATPPAGTLFHSMAVCGQDRLRRASSVVWDTYAVATPCGRCRCLLDALDSELPFLHRAACLASEPLLPEDEQTAWLVLLLNDGGPDVCGIGWDGLPPPCPAALWAYMVFACTTLRTDAFTLGRLVAAHAPANVDGVWWASTLANAYEAAHGVLQDTTFMTRHHPRDLYVGLMCNAAVGAIRRAAKITGADTEAWSTWQPASVSMATFVVMQFRRRSRHRHADLVRANPGLAAASCVALWDTFRLYNGFWSSVFRVGQGYTDAERTSRLIGGVLDASLMRATQVIRQLVLAQDDVCVQFARQRVWELGVCDAYFWSRFWRRLAPFLGHDVGLDPPSVLKVWFDYGGMWRPRTIGAAQDGLTAILPCVHRWKRVVRAKWMLCVLP